ncbi:hypothetical protein [Niabella ginsengisoli]|uniref:TFIIB-type zinc ribbon-containing protein n=1 Tax=Niabella ginsengisoli TaxID=522298 RepID=A0ABS9SQ39_9BACT|nr:hypothetical protein [Niabella ginsengisoli]MCH5600455.1 hypothetical protein [Niabella ginsengisoli]
MSNLFNTKCPSCNSKQLITSESSGSRVTLTCVACGRSFKASDNVENEKSFVQQTERNISTAQNSNDRYLPNEEALKQRALQIAQTDGVINAIKYWKDNTGWSLKETKDYIEKLLVSGGTVIAPANPQVKGDQEETAHQPIGLISSLSKLQKMKESCKQ